MHGLMIKEVNSLIHKPIIMKDGALLHNSFVVPHNMDKVYLKIENSDTTSVNINLSFINHNL